MTIYAYIYFLVGVNQFPAPSIIDIYQSENILTNIFSCNENILMKYIGLCDKTERVSNQMMSIEPS